MIYREIKWDKLSACAGLSIFETEQGLAEYNAMIHICDPALDVREQFDRIAQTVALLMDELQSVEIAFKRYFVSDAANQYLFIPDEDGAVSIVRQAPLNGTKVALWLYLLPAGMVKREANCTEITHGVYSHLFHTQIHAEAEYGDAQSERLFDVLIEKLNDRGCSLRTHCVRTWIFIQDIDSRYSAMAAARRACFSKENMTAETGFIASTGIEGAFYDPRILMFADAYSVKGLQAGQVTYLHAPTHLNPTHEYGVTFERGTAVRYGDRRHVIISGTASINNRGEIVHEGDVMKQAERMTENIMVLLAEAGAKADDIAYMIVYLRDVADYARVAAWMTERFRNVPAIIVHASVCRPGWLIEAECLAVTPEGDEKFDRF